MFKKLLEVFMDSLCVDTHCDLFEKYMGEQLLCDVYNVLASLRKPHLLPKVALIFCIPTHSESSWHSKHLQCDKFFTVATKASVQSSLPVVCICTPLISKGKNYFLCFSAF